MRTSLSLCLLLMQLSCSFSKQTVHLMMVLLLPRTIHAPDDPRAAVVVFGNDQPFGASCILTNPFHRRTQKLVLQLPL